MNLPGPSPGPGRFMGRVHGRGRNDQAGHGRGRGRDDGRRNAPSSDMMASDPPVTINSGSAVVSAGTVAAASSSACQRGRPPPDFQAFAADCDAQLMAVQTRRQSLQFQAETTSKQFAATDAPAAIQSSPEVFANLRDNSSSPAQA